MESTDNPQNPIIRRAYVIRPRPELSQRLEALELSEDLDFLGQPTVVMTEPLPFEGKLEGYRRLILRKCKEAFLQELLEFEPLATESHRIALLSAETPLEQSFDQWWTAEEVDTLEIATTW